MILPVLKRMLMSWGMFAFAQLYVDVWVGNTFMYGFFGFSFFR